MEMRTVGTDGAVSRHFSLSWRWGTPGELAGYIFAFLTFLWISGIWGLWKVGINSTGLVCIVPCELGLLPTTKALG